PSAPDRFLIEVRALARLDHPNIIRVLAVELDRPDPYFTMEYLDGGSLADRVAAGPLPPAEAATLVRDVARAVGVAHKAGILHRDLKPGNILLARTGEDQHDASQFSSVSTTPGNGHLVPIPKVSDF